MFTDGSVNGEGSIQYGQGQAKIVFLNNLTYKIKI